MATAAVRLPCVSIAPFGVPVVPPVYCSKARSVGASAGQDAGGSASGSVAKPCAASCPSQRASGANSTRGTAPSSSSHSAWVTSDAKPVVISSVAPESRTFCASSRFASNAERCTTRAPVRSAAKRHTGCQGVFGSSSAMESPRPIPCAISPAATRSASAWNWR